MCSFTDPHNPFTYVQNFNAQEVLSPAYKKVIPIVINMKKNVNFKVRMS
jgi:hypothetical protein